MMHDMNEYERLIEFHKCSTVLDFDSAMVNLPPPNTPSWMTP
jgi:hypothetical protein